MPAAVGDIDRNDMRELVRRGHIVQRDGIVFHSAVINDAAQVAAQLLDTHDDGFTVAEFRDATGASRKLSSRYQARALRSLPRHYSRKHFVSSSSSAVASEPATPPPRRTPSASPPAARLLTVLREEVAITAVAPPDDVVSPLENGPQPPDGHDAA